MPITEEQKQRLRSGVLVDPLVRQMLAGFLHVELKNNHGVQVRSDAIEHALKKFSDNVASKLDVAIQLYETLFVE